MLGTHTMISTGPIFAMVAFIFLTAPTAVKCDWPPLHKAAYEGDVATAKALVSSGALLNQKDFNEMTPLMWAAWKGKAGVVEWLVASSAKLDRQEKWGRTALILAADEGHIEVVRLLLQAGANPDILAIVPGDDKIRTVAASTAAKNKFSWYGKSALQIARDKGHRIVAELFSSKPDEAHVSESL